MGSSWDERAAHEEDVEEPICKQKRLREDTELDMTPMIDCVFLLLIFFTVSSKPDQQTAIQLPPAKYGAVTIAQDALIISVADAGVGKPANIFLADGKEGQPLQGNTAEQDEQVRKAVVEAMTSTDPKKRRGTVLVKAEKTVLHRDVSRVATAVGAAGPESGMESIPLSLAVMEVK